MAWKDDAACKAAPYKDIFFSVVDTLQQMAKERYCQHCPVADDCLRAALAERDTDAVRGNTTGEERRVMLRRRRKPTKAA